MRVPSLLAPACLTILGALTLARQAEQPAPTPVPELEGVSDVAGGVVRLADEPERAVLLFFHAGSSRYSLAGLDELVGRLAAAPETRARTRLFVLSATEDEARGVLPHLAALGGEARALVDRSRATFAAHGVIAAPTVSCVSVQRFSVARVQGYGALFAFRAELGARLAGGLIERTAYEAALAGAQDEPAPDAAETRVRLLAGKLVAAGQLEEAERLLGPARSAHPRAAWPSALQARCALQRGRADEARTIAAELARTHPEARETRYVEGLLLEAAGQSEQACEAFRTILERCLFE